MTIPNSNISFIDIWEEANGTYSSGELSLFKMSNFSYFSGPNGSNTLLDNNWGRGEFSGVDRIYNLTAQTSSFGVGDFSNLDYFYDNTNYKIILDVTNNVAPPPPFPPPPPTANEFNPILQFFDNSLTYNYISAGTGFVPPGGGNINTDISTTTTPLINTAYWELTLVPGSPFPASSADLTINGTPIFTGVVVNAGPATTVFNSTTYGTVDIGAITGGNGFEFVLDVY
jgi:hypothetical protein